MIAVGADGVVHLSYVSYGTPSADGSGVPATLWSAQSQDDGRTWSGFTKVATTTAVGSSTLPGTTLHRSIVQYLAVSPDRPGHLYVAVNQLTDGQVGVMLTASRDNGRTWSEPVRVNDDTGAEHQFSATVAAGPRRSGRRGLRHAGVVPAEGSRHPRGRSGPPRHLHRPEPANVPGRRQRACEDPTATCEDIFAGDYFSMQVSDSRVYVLSTSTHPRSSVLGDDARALHYQQQALTSVGRRHLRL